MKIKCLIAINDIAIGDIVDALKNPNCDEVVAYNKNGYLSYFPVGYYEILKEESAPKNASQIAVPSIRELLGQEIQGITFK